MNLLIVAGIAFLAFLGYWLYSFSIAFFGALFRETELRGLSRMSALFRFAGIVLLAVATIYGLCVAPVRVIAVCAVIIAARLLLR